MISLTAFVVAAVVGQAGALSAIPPKWMPAKPPASKVVATVNGQAIKASDVDSLLWGWYADQVREEVVNYLVVRTAAKKQSVKAAPKDVEAEVANQIQLYAKQLGPGQDVEKALKSQGLHRSRIYMGVETQMLLKSLILRRFDASEYVNVSTLIVKPKSDRASDLAVALNQCEEAYTKLVAGMAWDEALQKYGTDPNGVKVKGVLGWRLASIFPESVRQDFGKMKIGTYTKPVQTSAGIQIFRLDKRGKEAQGAELKELKDLCVSPGAQKQFLDDLKATAKITRS